MQQLENKTENYGAIEEALTAALPKGKVDSWLAFVKTDDNAFAVMGTCSDFDKKAMIAQFTMMEFMDEIYREEINNTEGESRETRQRD